jgi:hypothetical protein
VVPRRQRLVPLVLVHQMPARRPRNKRFIHSLHCIDTVNSLFGFLTRAYVPPLHVAVLLLVCSSMAPDSSRFKHPKEIPLVPRIIVECLTGKNKSIKGVEKEVIFVPSSPYSVNFGQVGIPTREHDNTNFT